MRSKPSPEDEIADLRAQLAEAHETLRAIRGGEVDALVVAGPQGDQIFTLEGADRPYRIFVEEMHEGAVTLLSDGTILYGNRRFAEMVSTPLETVIGSSIYRFVRPADRPAFDAILKEGLETSGKGELALLSQGDTVPVYLATSSLHLSGVEAVCLVVTDLTEQKRNEQIVADERLARSIFENATEAIVVCDTEGIILRASRAARRLFAGNPVGEQLERALPLLSIARKDRPAIPFDAVFAGRIVQGIEAELLLAEGESRQFQVSAGPLLAPDDRITGCVLTLTDITERRQAELEMDRARQEAEAANQAKDRFLATLSHELRTPLTPVLAVISALQDDKRIHPEVRGQISMMRRNVELEARLIDDLLDLTRIARGKLELRREVSDLRQILDHSLQTAMSNLIEKRLNLVMDLAHQDHRAWVDIPRLTQVFWNLFSNAVKFTPLEGTISVRSRREEAPTGAELVIEISDTGIGIEADALGNIFDAFNQGEQNIARRFGGLGLGLAISKTIVELHGGDLTATSDGRDCGALFSVRLPVSELAWSEAPAERPPMARMAQDTAPGESGETAPLHILLIEDHVDTAEAMADLLRAQGHRVTLAGSVATGLAAVEADENGGGVDLVVSDLGLPDGSGLDLMRSLHGRYGLRGIALSGYGMEEDVQRSLEAGFERHLTKPIEVRALEAAIQEVARKGA